VMIFPPIIGRLVDVTGTFISGFMVLGAVALVAAFGCLGLRHGDIYMIPETKPIEQPD
jgi:hypothetical protein